MATEFERLRLLAALSFMIVGSCCRPFKAWKGGMLVLLIAAFTLGTLLFGWFFDMTAITDNMLITIISVALGGGLLMAVSGFISRKITDLWQKRGKKADVR